MTIPRPEVEAPTAGAGAGTVLPLVAIVGRPNVGKSAVFNRLAGRRIAIVHERRGVTRDRLVCEAVWGGKRFQLADTGGLPDAAGTRLLDPIEAGVRHQIEAALQDAALVIFVVDVETGIAPLDEEAAGLLRRNGLPVLVAANKCDHEDRDPQSAEFERFGYPVFPVSALHDRGFEPLMERAVSQLPTVDPAARVTPIKVAVVGRPNVGKSSLVNRLLKTDRVIVSAIPGTTVDSIDIPFALGKGLAARHYVLTDTPGLRPERRVKDPVEYFGLRRAERSIRRAHVVVLILDALDGPREQDRKIAAQIRSHGKGCVMLVNKWDLAQGVTQREYEEALRRAAPFLDHVPVLFISALNGLNVRKTVDVVDRVASQIQTRLPTGLLNRVILAAHERIQPPMIGGKRLKIFYAVQTGVEPLRINLFVNDPKRLTPAYGAYLVKALRETFGLEGIPVVFSTKARRGKPQRMDGG